MSSLNSVELGERDWRSYQEYLARKRANLVPELGTDATRLALAPFAALAMPEPSRPRFDGFAESLIPRSDETVNRYIGAAAIGICTENTVKVVDFGRELPAPTIAAAYAAESPSLAKAA